MHTFSGVWYALAGASRVVTFIVTARGNSVGLEENPSLERMAPKNASSPWYFNKTRSRGRVTRFAVVFHPPGYPAPGCTVHPGAGRGRARGRGRG